MNMFQRFLDEVDKFADDAVGRRLGNGAKFYGKRKSSFYGDDDAERKADPNKVDAEEDFRGPAGGSYFVLSNERDDQGRPLGFLTRREAREQRAREEEERWEAARRSNEMLDGFSEALQRQDEDPGAREP
jgi:hypothetical protein